MKKEEEEEHLNWKDYIALTIAMLTTTLLPFIIFSMILIIILLVISLL